MKAAATLALFAVAFASEGSDMAEVERNLGCSASLALPREGWEDTSNPEIFPARFSGVGACNSTYLSRRTHGITRFWGGAGSAPPRECVCLADRFIPSGFGPPEIGCFFASGRKFQV